MMRRRQVVVVTAVVVVVLGLLALFLLFNSSGTNDVSDEPASGAPRESSTTQQKTIDSQPLIPGFKTVEFEGLVAQVPTDWPVRYLTVGDGCAAYDVPTVNFDARDPDTIDHDECGDIGSHYENSLFIGREPGNKFPGSPTTVINGEKGRVVTNEEDRLGIIVPDLHLFVLVRHPPGDMSIADLILKSLRRSGPMEDGS